MTDLISRDDAIRALSGACSTWEDDAKVQEIVMALPSAEPTGDLISRAEVHKILSLFSTEGGSDAKMLFMDAHESIDNIPSARPTGEWSTHEVACLLADTFGDTCACNYNGIDEWLPSVCEFANTECPHPVGVACWEQFVTNKFADMRGGDDE